MNSLRAVFISILSLSVLNTSFAQTDTKSGKDVALETLGSISGMMLYNTYLCIGAVADGYSADVYDDLTVEELMDEQISGLEAVEGQFNALLESDYLTDPSDRTYLADAIAAVLLLKQEAQALQDYAIDLDDGALADYNDNRNAAWGKITALLGIEE